jgi:hypothetical protein
MSVPVAWAAAIIGFHLMQRRLRDGLAMAGPDIAAPRAKDAALGGDRLGQPAGYPGRVLQAGPFRATLFEPLRFPGPAGMMKGVKELLAMQLVKHTLESKSFCRWVSALHRAGKRDVAFCRIALEHQQVACDSGAARKHQKVVEAVLRACARSDRVNLETNSNGAPGIGVAVLDAGDGASTTPRRISDDCGIRHHG